MPFVFRHRQQDRYETSPDQSLMRSLLDAGVPVASSCGGDGICGKCQLKIIKGDENLNPPTTEERLLRDQGRVKPGYRLSCQVHPTGDVEVDAAYW